METVDYILFGLATFIAIYLANELIKSYVGIDKQLYLEKRPKFWSHMLSKFTIFMFGVGVGAGLLGIYLETLKG